MKLNTLSLIVIVIFTWVNYSSKTNAQDIKFDKRGNVKYIKYDSSDKESSLKSPVSSNDFFHNVLGIEDGNTKVLPILRTTFFIS